MIRYIYRMNIYLIWLLQTTTCHASFIFDDNFDCINFLLKLDHKKVVLV